METLLQQWLLPLSRSVIACFRWLPQDAQAVAGALAALVVALASKSAADTLRWAKLHRQATDLHPDFTFREVERAARYFVPVHFQRSAPVDNPSEEGTIVRTELIPWMLAEALDRSREGRFFLILGGAGTGKTTVLINLFIRYRRQLRPWRRPFRVALAPLADGRALQRVLATKNKKSTILLLDGFDEDPMAVHDHRQRMKEVLEAVHDFRKVVVTCRTEFFLSEDDEPLGTGQMHLLVKERGEHQFERLYLAPFTDDDVRAYLRRRYSVWQLRRRRAAQATVQLAHRVMMRPLLLAYVEELSEIKQAPRCSAEVYQRLIRYWILREVARGSRSSTGDDAAKRLHELCVDLAVEFYRRWSRGQAAAISHSELLAFASGYHVAVDAIELRSGSLLGRNARGEYRFAHESIFEYLLACRIVRDADILAEFWAKRIAGVERFFLEFTLVGLPSTCVCFIGRDDDKIGSEHPIALLKRGERDIRQLVIKPGFPDHALAVVRLTPIMYLDLGESGVKSLAALSGSPLCAVGDKDPRYVLTSLRIAGECPEDLSPLCALSELKHLDLSATQIKDVRSLLPLTHVRWMTLPARYVEPGAAAELDTALPECTIELVGDNAEAKGARYEGREQHESV